MEKQQNYDTSCNIFLMMWKNYTLSLWKAVTDRNRHQFILVSQNTMSKLEPNFSHSCADVNIPIEM